MRLTPACIHTHEHLRPIQRFGTSSTSVYVHDGSEPILLAREHLLQLQLLDKLLRLGILRLCLLLRYYALGNKVGN